MPKTVRTVRRVLVQSFLVAVMFAVAGQVASASSAGSGSEWKTAAAVHADGLPCMSCGG